MLLKKLREMKNKLFWKQDWNKRESKESDFRRSKKLRRKGSDLLLKKKLEKLRKRKKKPERRPLPNRKLQQLKLIELLLKKPWLMP